MNLAISSVLAEDHAHPTAVNESLFNVTTGIL